VAKLCSVFSDEHARDKEAMKEYLQVSRLHVSSPLRTYSQVFALRPSAAHRKLRCAAFSSYRCISLRAASLYLRGSLWD
jgi:hypothetical protein